MKPTSRGALLRNYLACRGAHRICVVQAPDLETARERVPIALRALGVVQAGEVELREHRGDTMHWPWFGDAFFLTLAGHERPQDENPED